MCFFMVFLDMNIGWKLLKFLGGSCWFEFEVTEGLEALGFSSLTLWDYWDSYNNLKFKLVELYDIFGI